MVQGKMTFKPQDIIRKMRLKGDPAYTTGEIAEMFDASNETARKKLQKLHDDGGIHKKKPHSQCVMWWLPVFNSPCASPCND